MRYHDMRRFYDGSVPFEPWTLTTIKRVKRGAMIIFNTVEFVIAVAAVFSSGFVAGLFVAYLF